ncbi:MAG: hypothetical protein ACYCQJ_12740 [Nitrososphaerales archaeon]
MSQKDAITLASSLCPVCKKTLLNADGSCDFCKLQSKYEKLDSFTRRVLKLDEVSA